MNFELEKLKNYVIDSYCCLKIFYNDGMGSVPEYGMFVSKCSQAKILYDLAIEMGISDQLADPPDLDDEWDYWDGVEGVQYLHNKESYVSEEDSDLIQELGDLPDTIDEDLDEDEKY